MRKKHNTAIIAAVTVFSLVLLAGCRELPGKEAADQQLEESLSGSNSAGFLESLSLDAGVAAEDLGRKIAEAADDVHDAVKETAVEAAEQINENSLRQLRNFSQLLKALEYRHLRNFGSLNTVEFFFYQE